MDEFVRRVLTAFNGLMLEVQLELDTIRDRLDAIERKLHEQAADVDTADAVDEFRLDEIHARLSALEERK